MGNIEEGMPHEENKALDRAYQNRLESARRIKYQLHTDLASSDIVDQNSFGFVAQDWRCGVDVSSFNYFTSNSDRIHKSLSTVSTFTKLILISDIMTELEHELGTNKHRWSHVQLLPKKLNIPIKKLGITEEGINEMYTFAAVGYEHAKFTGAITGAQDVLKKLEKPGIPLLAYGKDMAEKMNSKQTREGNLTLELPTVLPGVITRYAYKPGENFAKISLVIGPIS